MDMATKAASKTKKPPAKRGAKKLVGPQDEFFEGIRAEKYYKGKEKSADEVYARVAHGLAQAEDDDRPYWEKRFRQAMSDGFIPAGRIMSACGTDIQATLVNCFVQPVGDCVSGQDDNGLPGIFDAITEAAETQRRGGGVGYDFSALRPKGAKVHGTRSRSSGPISYMRVFDRMCETVESAGARRGAQMGILRCDHPDIEFFVGAKDIREVAERFRAAGFEGDELRAILAPHCALSNFNISVAVTDAFMQAVADDRDFELVHEAEPDPAEHPNAHQRDDGMWVYRIIKAKDLWLKILRTTYETADPGVVFIDTMNRENNLSYCERIDSTNPCGEQPLPPFGCCCLGSIDLTRMVTSPFESGAKFDWAALRKLSYIAVRMLDNVLTVTVWPLEKQAQEAACKRRVGLGFIGLASAMAMLGIRYGSKESLKFTERVARVMRDAAYRSSIELASERSPFPLFDAKRYLASPFVQRLPDDIRDNIAKHGIRNSHLLSIAPTGTITQAFANNVSSGIEPVFAWHYKRDRKMMDGTLGTFDLEDGGYRLYREMGLPTDTLPKAFVTTQELLVEDHLAVQAAVQPYIDSAISKTINIPVDYPFEQFAEVYHKAWKAGLKGCTAFRPNDVTGSILTAQDDSKKEPGNRNPVVKSDDQTDPDRRVRLEKVPTPPLASLKWPGRPVLPTGNPSWTYMVDSGPQRFAVFVGHVEGDVKYPFEVWVNGAEQPRGLGATAKLLSMDMRSQDREWLKLKLETLAKTRGVKTVTVPDAEGQPIQYSSATAAMAALVKRRCEALGSFDSEGPTPVLDALASPKEPKTTAEGTMSWSVDIRNPNTGDDFVLTLKELETPDGRRLPYSVWLSGDYPDDFNGLSKLLSLDMRIVDPAWIGVKLAKLLNYAEPMGEFMAFVPGAKRQQTWPSTVAYMAGLILHRYRVLDILDDQHTPVVEVGVLQAKNGTAAKSTAIVVDQSPDHTPHAVAGTVCPDCGALSVVKHNGCKQCTACGWLGDCGG